MKGKLYQEELSALALLKGRSQEIESSHMEIANDLQLIRAQLLSLADSSDGSGNEGGVTMAASSGYTATPFKNTSLDAIYAKAHELHPDARINDVLDQCDLRAIDTRFAASAQSFNEKYNLDKWDYAIAGCSGLLGGVLDLLFVRPPPKPGMKWDTPVDGTFNKWVQDALNKWLPPELSKKLGNTYKIGAPDSSVWTDLVDAPQGVLNPLNHRLRSLAHDPILGFFFGVYDMIHGTCTVVVNGEVRQIPSTKGPSEGSLFQLLGRMFGHLLSDVNAPSAKGNRGMGLPAPFMGLLRMFEHVNINGQSFGKQIEWMYINGYDFRQFLVTSIPVAIMEVIVRTFYVIKQVAVNKIKFTDALMETLPGNMSPRFRVILALSYGASSAVNAGKMYATGNLLNLNYASWMGLFWNGSHAVKWSLYGRHMTYWSALELAEISALLKHAQKLDNLTERASFL